ncbi:hypothetical protein [Micromonospora deserti]|uniref:Uncharacterized protein n=1 Tax=Micromonospora deserti TaxID=2070366 RepID=A0A2W2CRD1_9ACTN|nr:hypothetical protein [Micromonospora deserti]PZG02076.1 hypothetical protein C1I99_04050 [Micromonospora deserti]
MDHEYFSRLVRGARAEAMALIDGLAGGIPAGLPHRETMRAVKALILADATAAPGTPASAGGRPAVDALLAHLAGLQGPTGLFDGDNLVSPPDSAFTINDVCLVLEVLDRVGADTRWTGAVERLRTIAARSVDALVTGGVHTPNHRWELASALAGLHHVTGDDRLVPRIDEWLAEGIDVDADGFYSERSAIYSAVVTNPSLVTLARLLARPELLDPVRANLRTLPSLVDDDGEVVTVHSRRQDQRETFHVHAYLSQLRRFAVTDGDGQLARLAMLGAASGPPEPSRHLAEALVDPVLTELLPAPVPAREGGTFWPTVGLLRRRAGVTTTTVFGGADTRATGRVASGLANSATVLQVRHGAARLCALRISPQFFATGAFRPTVMDVADDRVRLTEERVSGYYQPLPSDHRRSDGAYPLTDEGRFFARMDFPARMLSPLRLTTCLQVTLTDDGAVLELRFTGPRTRVAVELVFGGGTLTGAVPHPSLAGTQWLRGPSVLLRTGSQAIEVQVDGHDEELAPSFDDGEFFAYVHGEDRVPGQRVLLAAWSDRPVRLLVRAQDGA